MCLASELACSKNRESLSPFYAHAARVQGEMNVDKEEQTDTSKIETFATASDDAATDKQVAPRPSTRYVAKKFRPKREQEE